MIETVIAEQAVIRRGSHTVKDADASSWLNAFRIVRFTVANVRFPRTEAVLGEEVAVVGRKFMANLPLDRADVILRNWWHFGQHIPVLNPLHHLVVFVLAHRYFHEDRLEAVE